MPSPKHSTPRARKRWHFYETWPWPAVLRDLRAWADITRTQLSQLTGIPMRTIERWEQGRSQPKYWKRRQIGLRFHKQPRKFFDAVRTL